MFRSLLIAALLTPWAALGDDAGHPRLLFGPGDIPALREKLKKEPFASMFAKYKVAAESPTGDETAPEYGESVAAHRCAFLYVLTGEDAWAKRARTIVEKRINDGANWANPKTKGLRLYHHGRSMALCY